MTDVGRVSSLKMERSAVRIITFAAHAAFLMGYVLGAVFSQAPPGAWWLCFAGGAVAVLLVNRLVKLYVKLLNHNP